MNSSRPVPGLSVVHVVDEGAWGGLATFLTNLIKSQERDTGIRSVHLVCDPEQMDPALRQLPVVFHAYKSDRRLSRAVGVSAAISAHLNNIRPDVVILHSSFPGFWGRRLRHPSWKVIYCAHGWSFLQRVSFLKQFVYRCAERYLSWRTDAIVSISDFEFRSAEDAGIRPRLHQYIRHGLKPALVKDVEPIPLSGDDINLLFIGRLDRQKGLDILLNALDEPELSHVKLWVVGRNVIGEGIEVRVGPNVRLLGWIPNDQIDGIISQMDAVIVPSRWEGFGLVALEAMRNGRAVVASAVGGLAEIVRDGVNGRLVNISDMEHVRSVLKDLRRHDLVRMGGEGYLLFQKEYCWQESYNAWRALIARVSG